jgi:hypothetical protein
MQPWDKMSIEPFDPTGRYPADLFRTTLIDDKARDLLYAVAAFQICENATKTSARHRF